VPAVASAKQRSFELLGASPGARLLDAGCGTGTDSLALARRVHPAGEVVGVDLSTLALASARARAGGHPSVRFEHADLAALPFIDNSFDGARADRTIQHLREPERAIAELARVTRAGGRVVLTEARFVDVTEARFVDASGARRRSPGTRGARRRSPGTRGPRDVLAFLPFLLHRFGVESICVEQAESTVDAGPDILEVLGARSGRVQLHVVHVAGTVAR
jgi:SAM-dependent methyltransferase